MRTSLYRFYGLNNQLLYVGMSKNPFQRLNGHKRDKEMHLVSRIDLQWFETRTAAVIAERIAIRNEKPLWNKAHQAMEQLTDWELPPVFLGPDLPWRRFSVGLTDAAPHNLSFARDDLFRLMRAVRRGDEVYVCESIDLPEWFKAVAVRMGVAIRHTTGAYVEPPSLMVA